MTTSQTLILEALSHCTMGVGSEKRFVRQMQGHADDLTPRQAAFLEIITHHYRKQLEWRTLRNANHAEVTEIIRTASATVQARKDAQKIQEATK